MPKVSLAVVLDESVQARCKFDYFILRKLSGDCNGPEGAVCDASGKFLSSNSGEEIAKKQRDHPALRCHITFVESAETPSESD